MHGGAILSRQKWESLKFADFVWYDQEPGDGPQIKSFASGRGAKFQIADKIDVNGTSREPSTPPPPLPGAPQAPTSSMHQVICWIEQPHICRPILWSSTRQPANLLKSTASSSAAMDAFLGRPRTHACK